MRANISPTGTSEGASQYISIKRDRYSKKRISKASIVLQGSGTEIGDASVIEERTKIKLITAKVMLSLIDVAKKKGDAHAIQSYWNTFHCQSKLYTSNGKSYGKYCKNRFCALCCRIRKADIINRYIPVIQTWDEPHFVTLTEKAVTAKGLPKRIKDMNRAFKILMQRNKKRHQRGKEIRMIGIKSLECNFNPVKRTYNPHFHLIVPNKAVADLIIKEWLALWTEKYTSPYAQDSRKITNLETALIEVVKYSSKIFTEPNGKKSKIKVKPIVYVSALHNIIWSMKDIRIFERFGFNLPKDNMKHERSERVSEEYREWNYNFRKRNWFELNSNELLTDYDIPPEILDLIYNNLDIEME